LAREANERVAQAAPWAIFANSQARHAWQPYVRGYRPHPLYWLAVRDAWLDLPRKRLAAIAAMGRRTRLAALLPLLEDITLPECIPEEELYTVWAWFSGKGVRTWLHYDNNGCHNLNAQVSGSKRALLFPPTDLEHIPLFEPSHASARVSRSSVWMNNSLILWG
jgi:hypothetical protein